MTVAMQRTIKWFVLECEILSKTNNFDYILLNRRRDEQDLIKSGRTFQRKLEGK